MSKGEMQQLSRRTFVKGSTITALAAAAGAGALGSLYGCSTAAPDGSGKATAPEEKVTWSFCGYCGDTCPMQVHTVDGVITWVESDNRDDPNGIQLRGCPRAHSMRWYTYSPDRVKYPMKRVGKRGDAEFEQISWDEAIDLLEEKLKYTIDTYGNAAINCPNPYFFEEGIRFFNLIGGHLGIYGNLSAGAFAGAMGVWGAAESSPLTEAENADILLMFGNNPLETRLNGYSSSYNFINVRESGTKVINIDYRLNETSSGFPDEWIPIRPGTDSALVAALAYVLITENLVDEDFLHTYTQGYDEQTMPDGAPPNSSYKDYILGTGYDMVAKTPDWAAPITLIPAERITELALEIGNAGSVFVCQGFGIQRQPNGESSVLAICTLPLLIGQLGKPGTNNGGKETTGIYNTPIPFFPMGENPIPAAVSEHMWYAAAERGAELTATHDGVQGAEKLDVGTKFLFLCGSNCLHNQGGDVNKMHEILTDESKVEFIVVMDPQLTSSARYADLLLPKTSRVEDQGVWNKGTCEYVSGAIYYTKAIAPYYESKSPYDLFTELSDRFGVKDAYTEGRDDEGWAEWFADVGRENDPTLPTWEEGKKLGVVVHPIEEPVGMKNFVDDPQAFPTWLPSGKIEIYSTLLAGMAAGWEFDDPRDIITPIPMFVPGRESYLDLTEEYPLLLSCFKWKGSVNSNYANLDILNQASRRQVWINPFDAESRGIQHGDMCRIFNDRGEIHIEARVTPRIIPGTIALPNGTWHNADMNGDKIDRGGCPNTLSSAAPTPIAKANPVGRSIAQIEKL
jgi:DmsA/YnfE family anaerobic dimethyl sulfoxide reductase A subunit